MASHVAKREPRRNDHTSYQAIDRELGRMQAAPMDSQGGRGPGSGWKRGSTTCGAGSAYRLFDSRLGPILLAHSEQGVVLLEYLHGRGDFGVAPARVRGVEAVVRTAVRPRTSTGLRRTRDGCRSDSRGRWTCGWPEPVPAEGARAHGPDPVRRGRLVQASGSGPRPAQGSARRSTGAGGIRSRSRSRVTGWSELRGS